MEIDGWKYYNHAAIPTTAPHEEPDLLPVKNGQVWKIGGGGRHHYLPDGLQILIVGRKQTGGM